MTGSTLRGGTSMPLAMQRSARKGLTRLIASSVSSGLGARQAAVMIIISRLSC